MSEGALQTEARRTCRGTKSAFFCRSRPMEWLCLLSNVHVRSMEGCTCSARSTPQPVVGLSAGSLPARSQRPQMSMMGGCDGGLMGGCEEDQRILKEVCRARHAGMPATAASTWRPVASHGADV